MSTLELDDSEKPPFERGLDMIPAYGIAHCSACNALVADRLRGDDPEHLQCPGCGSTLPLIAGPANKSDMVLWQSGVSRRKAIRMRSAFVPQRNRAGAIGHHERLVDPSADRYREKVTMLDTREVTHDCDEPLSQHRGHGADKTSAMASRCGRESDR